MDGFEVADEREPSRRRLLQPRHPELGMTSQDAASGREEADLLEEASR
jgi:hypothetical protein